MTIGNIMTFRAMAWRTLRKIFSKLTT